MNDLLLIYVHKIGVDYKDKFYYEFIFSDSLKNVDGDGWDTYPANGEPSPPFEELIMEVGKVETDFKLEVAQDNTLFSMYDAVDGIIPLAWEDIEGLDEYPEKRMIFHYGTPINKVSDILYEKDIRIVYQKKYKNEKN